VSTGVGNTYDTTGVDNITENTFDTTWVDNIAETTETRSDNMDEHTEIETYSKDMSINHMNPQEQHKMHEEWRYNEPAQEKEIIEEMNATNVEHYPETNDEEGNSQMTEN